MKLKKLGKTVMINCPKVDLEVPHASFFSDEVIFYSEKPEWVRKRIKYKNIKNSNIKIKEDTGVYEDLKYADTLFIGGVDKKVSEEELKECRNLKYVGVHATGYNILPYIRNSKYIITHIPNYATESTAELTYAYKAYWNLSPIDSAIFSLINNFRHILMTNETVLAGNECEFGGVIGEELHKKFLNPEIKGELDENQKEELKNRVKKLFDCKFHEKGEELVIEHYTSPFKRRKIESVAAVGLGNIGKRVIELFDDCYMEYNTKHHSKHIKEEKELGIKGRYVNSLKKLVRDKDFVTLHVAENKSTLNLINFKILKNMKKEAILANTSRSSVVNLDDLFRAMNEYGICYCSDQVWGPKGKEREFINKCKRYGLEKQLLLNPHIGFNTFSSRSRKSNIFVRNVMKYLQGKRGKEINEVSRKMLRTVTNHYKKVYKVEEP